VSIRLQAADEFAHSKPHGGRGHKLSREARASVVLFGCHYTSHPPLIIIAPPLDNHRTPLIIIATAVYLPPPSTCRRRLLAAAVYLPSSRGRENSRNHWKLVSPVFCNRRPGLRLRNAPLPGLRLRKSLRVLKIYLLYTCLFD
jgi:hypothetical protein